MVFLSIELHRLVLPETNDKAFGQSFVLNNVTGCQQKSQRLQDLHLLDRRLHQHPVNNEGRVIIVNDCNSSLTFNNVEI